MHQSLSVLFLIIYVAFVIYTGIRNSNSRNTSDYFLASRSLPAWLLSITFIASWWGGGSAIDLVDIAFNDGLASFWIYGVPVLVATLVMFLLAGKIRGANTISQSEIIVKRYNQTAGKLLTLFILIFMSLSAAVQVVVIGHFFESSFDISYTLGAVLGSSIVLIYSMFGGFKGVVLTDLLQFVFFLAGGIILFFYAYYLSDGFEAIEAHAQSSGNHDYTTFWKHAPDYFVYIFTFGTSWAVQANVWQRISAAKNSNSARKMMAISFFAFIPLYLMVSLTGMFSSVIFDSVPKGGIVAKMITMIDIPLLSALIFVGLCSAIMSTMDSLLNTGALSLTVDIYQKHINPKASPEKTVTVARFSTLLVFMVALLIGVRIESVLSISWIGADFITTGAFVPLIGGFFWKRATARAAVASMIFGLLFSSYNMLIALGIELPAPWQIASAEQALTGMGISLILFIGISLADKKPQK